MAERLKADRRLYADADRTRILEEDHPDGAFLLYAEGKPIQPGDVKRYELTLDEHGRIAYPGVTLPAPTAPDASELVKRKAAIEARLEAMRPTVEQLIEELEAIDAELGVELVEGGEEEEGGEEGDGDPDAETLEQLEAKWSHDMDAGDYFKRWPETEAGELAGKIVAARAARAAEGDAGAS